MMIKTQLSRPLVLTFIILCLLQFISLNKIPIFADEANHLRMADIIRHNPGSIIDFAQGGILPGLLLPLSFLETIFARFNLLLVGRAFSSLANILSAYFLYLIGKKLFNSHTGLLAGQVFLAFPLNFFHGRLVMLEPLMTLFFLTAFYTYLTLLNNWDNKPGVHILLQGSFLTSLLLSLSFITKPLVIIHYIALLTLPLIYPNSNKISFKTRLIQLLLGLAIILVVTVATLPFVYLSSGHFYEDYVLRNLAVLWTNFKMNIWRSYLWVKIYYRLPVLLLAGTSLIFAFKEKNIKLLWLFGWAFLIICLDSATGGKLFYPRHLLPLSLPLSFLVAWPLSRFLAHHKNAIMAVLVIVYIIWLPSQSFLTNPEKAELAPEDKLQFYQDWPSGAGLKEIAQDLKRLSQNRPITVYVGDEALLTWALKYTFDIGHTQLITLTNYTGGETHINLEAKVNRGENSYLLLNKEPYGPRTFPAKVVVSYAKGPHRNIVLYKLRACLESLFRDRIDHIQAKNMKPEELYPT